MKNETNKYKKNNKNIYVQRGEKKWLENSF